MWFFSIRCEHWTLLTLFIQQFLVPNLLCKCVATELLPTMGDEIQTKSTRHAVSIAKIATCSTFHSNTRPKCLKLKEVQPKPGECCKTSFCLYYWSMALLHFCTSFKSALKHRSLCQIGLISGLEHFFKVNWCWEANQGPIWACRRVSLCKPDYAHIQ